MTRAVGQHLAERHPIDVRIDGNLTLTVVALDLGRPPVVGEQGDVADLDHLAGPGRYQQVAHHRRVVPIRLVEPETDDELIVAVLELRHLFAADERAQVGGQRIDVDAEVGRADAVDGDPQLGLRRFEVRVRVDDAIDGVHLLDQLIGVRLQLIDVRSLNENLQAVAAAVAAALVITAAAAG